MKHTKGEWKFNGFDIIVGENIGQKRICTMIEHRAEFKKEDEADANLIAAAPDLLVALKDLQEAVREHGLLNVKKRFSLCAADAQANTAIAKATQS